MQCQHAQTGQSATGMERGMEHRVARRLIVIVIALTGRRGSRVLCDISSTAAANVCGSDRKVAGIWSVEPHLLIDLLIGQMAMHNVIQSARCQNTLSAKSADRQKQLCI